MIRGNAHLVNITLAFVRYYAVLGVYEEKPDTVSNGSSA